MESGGGQNTRKTKHLRHVGNPHQAPSIIGRAKQNEDELLKKVELTHKYLYLLPVVPFSYTYYN